MRIQHNMRSMNANRQLKNTSLSKAKTMEKLSSGYKINRAADDAAGLAISEKMRSQIRGLNQTVRNVEDGISFVQVADGSLEEVQQMLHRMHELSVQSANGINTEEDRGQLDSEVQQLKSEIDDIFENTEFNTKKIWKGEPVLVETIVGTTSVSGISINAFGTNSNITDTNKEAIPRTSISVSATNSGLSFSWTGYNGNSYSTDVIPWEADPTGTHVYQVGKYIDKTKYPELAGVNFEYGYSALSEAKLEDIIRSLNGRYISNYVNSNETTVMSSSDKSVLYSTGASIDYTYELQSGKSFNSTDNGFIEATKVGGSYANVVARADDYNDPLNFTFDMRNVGAVETRLTGVTYYSNDYNMNSTKGENIWWRYRTDSKGKVYQTTIYHNLSNPKGNLQEVLDIFDNNTDLSFSAANNPVNGNVYFSYDLMASGKKVGTMNVYFSLKARDGVTPSQIKASYDSLKAVDINPSGNSQLRIYNNAVAKAGNIITNTYGYEYENRGNLTIQAGANSGQVLSLDYSVMSNEYFGIEGLAVDTQQEAENAITVAQEALQKVSKVRSTFGAFQNRLEHTLEYNKNASENLQNAESRLRDADYAEEMVQFSKNNILMEMGQQVLSMANSDPESVLNLLRV